MHALFDLRKHSNCKQTYVAYPRKLTLSMFLQVAIVDRDATKKQYQNQVRLHAPRTYMKKR